LYGKGDEITAAAAAKFLHDIAFVLSHGLVADEKGSGDFFVLIARSDEFHDLFLPMREQIRFRSLS